MKIFRMILAGSLLSLTAISSLAQTRADAASTTNAATSMPAKPGEIWAVTTVTDFVGARDTTPKREKQQELGCFAPGEVTVAKAAEIQLPIEFRGRCWIASQRAEPLRQQVKYACSDSTTAETATRQNPDGSFGSQIVVNVPEKGGISITRTMRKAPGKCDLSKLKAVPATPLALPPK
ncbi:MAG: hypothetical protein ABI905_16285 [Betaproteobacteria bacterium]